MSSKSWRESLLARQQNKADLGLWRQRRHIGSVQQPLIKSDDAWLTNFSSNDYLGLAAHPQVAEAMSTASHHWGVGSGASHMVCGHQAPHHKLEQELAEFVGAERAVLFSNGYMANLALGMAFAEKDDLYLHDKLNHASLIEGARLSAAQFRRYAHVDLNHARKIILGNEHQRLLLASDAVFSMDGDMAPLAELKGLADHHSALLFIDDAHGFGVLGPSGAGSLASVDLAPQGNIAVLGTLGKALGSFGAFIAADGYLIEHIVQYARSYIYTTALPSPVVAASSAALGLLKRNHGALKAHLDGLISLFIRACGAEGIPLLPSATAIQPVLIGDEVLAEKISAYLEKLGFLVPSMRTPTVPKGRARLRVTLTAAHTEYQVQALVDGLAEALAAVQGGGISASDCVNANAGSELSG